MPWGVGALSRIHLCEGWLQTSILFTTGASKVWAAGKGQYREPEASIHDYRWLPACMQNRLPVYIYQSSDVWDDVVLSSSNVIYFSLDMRNLVVKSQCFAVPASLCRKRLRQRRLMSMTMLKCYHRTNSVAIILWISLPARSASQPGTTGLTKEATIVPWPRYRHCQMRSIIVRKWVTLLKKLQAPHS